MSTAPATTPPRLLRAHAAAAYLGIAPSTLAKTRVFGTGPRFRRLGRTVVYELSDLDAFIDSCAPMASTSDNGAEER